MRNQPPLDQLLKRADSKYTVVLAVARRARKLVEDRNAPGRSGSFKPVGTALTELADGRLTYHFRDRETG